jgi:four helix bundle protein
MAIGLKEASETEYWVLLLLRETGFLTLSEAQSLLDDNHELLKLLTSIIKSAKKGRIA